MSLDLRSGLFYIQSKWSIGIACYRDSERQATRILSRDSWTKYETLISLCLVEFSSPSRVYSFQTPDLIFLENSPRIFHHCCDFCVYLLFNAFYDSCGAAMDGLRRKRFPLLRLPLLLVLNFSCSLALGPEGLALLKFRERVEVDPFGALSNWNGHDPCSWFGVVCLDGRVIVLNLQDLCLVGTLAPELGKLRHLRSLILHNNSFFGTIPEEIGELKELEVLDLRHNDLSAPLPPEIRSILPQAILLLSNNRLLRPLSPESQKLSTHSEIFVHEDMPSGAAQEACWNQRSIRNDQTEDASNRRLLQAIDPPASPNGRHANRNRITSSPSPSQSQSPSLTPSSPPISLPPSATAIFLPPAPAPAPTDDPSSPAPAPAPASASASVPASPPPALVPTPSPSETGILAQSGHNKFPWVIYLSVVLGTLVLVGISAISIIYCRNSTRGTVKPWATGLSGQLQKAFVTGVPSLRRTELETACEDFSNIIGTSSDSTFYKGTLSNGVEIAVIASAVTSARDWSKHSEARFRKKIATLSKVNHKNFVNLLGYCEEEEPFTRMMVFEYAPNGTLFEHLHVKEAEHLDWAMRLRIAMGMAYCLEYMHQLDPPIFHKKLHSKTVYLTDDYAAKLADFSFWNEPTAKTNSSEVGHQDTASSNSESIVYSFGLILLEMMTGKLPYSQNEGLILGWALDYLRGDRPIASLMDPTLKTFEEEEARALRRVILSCLDSDQKQRPTMQDLAAQMREITAMAPDAATPRLSPLWWAELEVLSSTDAS
ncbi:hypothetical protein ACLOJK_031644 [Asimina triloba]